MCDIDRISNELEFGVHGVDAANVIDAYGASLVPEVNPRDVAELNVSMAPDITALNERLYTDVERLISTAESLGGMVYGGAAVFADVSGVEPKRHRTTSMSETLAHGFLDITSQQVVLGIADAGLGFELYQLFRRANPVFIALTASSPYRMKGNAIVDTGNDSRRIEQYKNLCSFLPAAMWSEAPDLHSLEGHRAWLQKVSRQLKERLEGDLMDANWEELRKARSNGNGNHSYYPFDVLEPHQVYCFVRVRPDHRTIEKGGKSLFSLELRVPDMPATRERMQMLNALVVGLAYYAADHGVAAIPQPYSGSFQELETAARHGLDAEINGIPVRRAATYLQKFAARGLEGRGYHAETKRFDLMEQILMQGNDASLIRRTGLRTADGLRSYMASRLKAGEA